MLGATDSAEYMRLLRIGRDVTENSGNLPELRLAILAEHASQQLTHVIKAKILELGFFPVIYEADYSTAALEAYDPASGLYAFAPDVVFFSLAAQKYRDNFLSNLDPEWRERLPQAYAGEVMGIVDAMLSAGLGVIVSNLALPVERMFGNFSAQTSLSLYGSALKFNALLVDAVAQRRGCQLNDVMYLASRIGGEAFFDERLWASAKYLCANRHLPEVAHGVARAAAARKGRMSKCLVLDLDNTLWGGVIGDDGKDGIALGGDAYGEQFQLFQRYILSLKARGYILAVCSKNNEEVALDAFRNHPEMILAEGDIAVFVANWNDKASNIEYIARVLNIGLDSLVFIDDSPFERELVKAALPMVAVPDMPEDVADYMRAIEASGVLEAIGYSNEDYHRNQKYREEALRTTEQIKYGSIDEYLQSLRMTIVCSTFVEDSLPRVAQLLQRSNQFNLCTRRFSEADCERMMNDPAGYHSVQARLSDRFGDYGLISVICTRVADKCMHIEELVMSCRVLRRGVEEYLMNHLFQECRRRNLKGIFGEYIKTAKNAMVKDFYENFGYRPVPGPGGRNRWYLGVDEYRMRPAFIGEG